MATHCLYQVDAYATRTRSAGRANRRAGAEPAENTATDRSRYRISEGEQCIVGLGLSSLPLLLPLILAGCRLRSPPTTRRVTRHADRESVLVHDDPLPIVTAIMWALLFSPSFKRRGTLSEHAPIDSGGGQVWIAVGGMAIPLLILS